MPGSRIGENFEFQTFTRTVNIVDRPSEQAINFIIKSRF